jgi:hypothetical protein
MQGGLPDSHPHINKTKCRKNTVVSPDDGPIVTQNVLRFMNILRINGASGWFYLEDYTEMHVQQNIKKKVTDICQCVRKCMCGVITSFVYVNF